MWQFPKVETDKAVTSGFVVYVVKVKADLVYQRVGFPQNRERGGGGCSSSCVIKSKKQKQPTGKTESFECKLVVGYAAKEASGCSRLIDC